MLALFVEQGELRCVHIAAECRRVPGLGQGNAIGQEVKLVAHGRCLELVERLESIESGSRLQRAVQGEAQPLHVL